MPEVKETGQEGAVMEEASGNGRERKGRLSDAKEELRLDEKMENNHPRKQSDGASNRDRRSGGRGGHMDGWMAK